MKRILLITIAAACLISAGCNSVMNLMLSVPARQDWPRVQSSGGMRLGIPFRTNGCWCAPIECNAAGFLSITRKPNGPTSYPVYYSGAKMKIEGSKLLVFLRMKGDQNGYRRNGDIKKVCLPKGTTNGVYDVFYLDEEGSQHFVQKLIVSEQPLKTNE